MGWSWPGNRQASPSGAALLIIQALKPSIAFPFR